jgi:DNA-binding transcriptional MocR family regulator
MELFLDPGDHRSLTVQLYDQLREAIADGRLPPGTAALTTFIDEGHFGRHLRRARRVYAERHLAV